MILAGVIEFIGCGEDVKLIMDEFERAYKNGARAIGVPIGVSKAKDTYVKSYDKDEDQALGQFRVFSTKMWKCTGNILREANRFMVTYKIKCTGDGQSLYYFKDGECKVCITMDWK